MIRDPNLKRRVFRDDETPAGFACVNGHPWCNLCVAPVDLSVAGIERTLQTLWSVDEFGRRWDRHTVDLDRNRFQLVDAPESPKKLTGAHLAWVFLAGLMMGYVLGRWVLPHAFGV